MTEAVWKPPPPVLPIERDAVHVWRMPLDADEDTLARLSTLLSDDERQRAARFHFERDRRRSIVAHGRLRTLLGQYLQVDPAGLRFAYGARGKPYLAEQDLQFNLSHSHELALCAFAHGCELGIDVEQIRTDFATEDIAKRFFSPGELASLARVPGEQQRALAFFNCWTRKEAYIKARGDGLAIPLDSFDVTLAPGEAARLLAVRGAPDAAARWSLLALDAAPGYAAALAFLGHGRQLACYETPT